MQVSKRFALGNNACAGAIPKKFLRLALPDVYVGRVGTHEWLLDQYGLSAPKIARKIQKLLT